MNTSHVSESSDRHVPMPLGIAGFEYADLHDPARLPDLLATFDDDVRARDPELLAEFEAYRQCEGEGMKPEAISDLLVRMAPHVSHFVVKLFQLEIEYGAQQTAIRDEMESVIVFKNEIVATLERSFKDAAWHEWDHEAIAERADVLPVLVHPDTAADDPERAMARAGVRLLKLAAHYETVAKGVPDDYPTADADVEVMAGRIKAHPRARELFAACLDAETPQELVACLLENLREWTYLAKHHPMLRKQFRDWVSFKVPAKSDPQDLVAHETRQCDGFEAWVGPRDRQRRRDGFSLTDPRFGERRVLYEVDHCKYCHDRDADSCAKGMRQKKAQGFKVNQLGVHVTGCPLGEKISEALYLKRSGDNIAALALIVIDNPMCPGTGHRICNDCMKGCIYQKTEPVNIPQIETSVLTDVLFMPWGFEIYSFLTRWNPLNVKRPYALPYNGRNILVVGMGPAGYTLAHYLLNEGFGVVGIDALKLEPVPKRLTGDWDVLPVPIRGFRQNFYEDLDHRLIAGFGGVAEYGITVRWDKNFLRVMYLALARRRGFRSYGGIRFGGTWTIDDAWEAGFDHIAIATGAGKPTIIGLKNNLIRGIRMASDFLMSLQLTGAAKESSLANLQVRLPAGVIGGGLTAIDTATEVMAYYPRQVEKLAHRYQKLIALHGESMVRARYDEEELGVLDEFLSHGHAVLAERERARMAGDEPNFAPLIERWGGVTLFYRKGIKNSPAYRQNHEEINEALQEGIALAEGMSPLEAIPDKHGALAAVRFQRLTERDGGWVGEGGEIPVPLHNLFIAAGTSPNTIYQQEYPDTFDMDVDFFQRFEPQRIDGDIELQPMHDQAIPKIGKPAPFTSYHANGKYISFYGDNHPVYAGNVVKAMASARDGYPYVVDLFADELALLDPARQPARDQQLETLFNRLDDELTATIMEVNRLTPTIIEVVVRAPMAARKFHPGQFYRVQNLEWYARTVEDTTLTSEGIALTGASVDEEKGLISLITLEMGSSSRLCATWKPGNRVIVMGVTGTPTEIAAGQTVALIGGGLGNAVQFSIGKALRAAGSRVIYFAGYKSAGDVFMTDRIEAAADVIVWSVDPAPGVERIPTTRPGDKTFVGNIIDTLLAYGRGDLGDTVIPLNEVNRMIVIGSDRMMSAVKEARHGVLAPYLRSDHAAIGSINSPMQCMMKGVCAQCLCRHVDPDSGEEFFVYSCYNQDQDLDSVDFEHLHARLRQNTVQEKLSNMWLDYLIGRPVRT